MILIVAVKYATPLSLGSMYGLNEFYCPLRIAPSDTVYILTACGKTIHLCSSSFYITTVTTAVGDVLHLNVCIPQGVAWGGVVPFCSCKISIKYFSFCLLLRRVCNCVQTHLLKGKKVLRKIFRHPPSHSCIFVFCI